MKLFAAWPCYVPDISTGDKLLKKSMLFVMRTSFFSIAFTFLGLQVLLATPGSGQQMNDTRIILELKNESLEKAFKQIEKQTDYLFAFQPQQVQKYAPVSLPKATRTVAATLDILLAKTDLSYRQSGNNIIIYQKEKKSRRLEYLNGAMAADTPTEKISVTGFITDATGAFLPFVNIWVKGARKGTQTTERGEYTLTNVKPNDTLLIAYIGYDTSQVPLRGRTQMNMILAASTTNTLSDVVVVSTGLQQLPKERATGSFSTISGKDLEKIPVPNVIQRMEGLIPGVKISVLSGDRSFIYSGGNQLSINSATRTVGVNDYNMVIRGTGTYSGDKFPLIVVDGAITDLDISTLNPDDIDNITFLKDAAAASIWGVRAANGVMVITTKKGKNTQVPQVNFSVSAMVAEKPNLGYMRTMNSAQMIDYETEVVNRGFLVQGNITPSAYFNATYYPGPAAVLALKLKAGTITQAAYNTSIDSLKQINNRSQVSQYLLQPASNQQYNLSVSGGNNFSSYYYSASYSRESPNTRNVAGQRLTLTLNNTWKLFKTATLTTSLKGSFFTYQNNGIPLSDAYNVKTALLPYQLLVDNTGKSVNINRLNPDYTATLPAVYKNWTYNYINELDNANNVQKDNNYVANISLKVPIYRGLAATVLYTNERTYSTGRVYYNPQTYFFRNLVNNYTYPSAPAANQLLLTTGGIYNLTNTTVNNYALRGQLSFDKTINRIHQVNAIAGSEIRQTQVGTGTSTLYGYNPATGLSTNVSFINSYYTIQGGLSSLGGAPAQADKRRRYLSYFSNIAYTLLGKYSVSASARYDDYNNFGLDRKYRATPLWSSGVKWNITEENFMKKLTWVNNLGLRVTYGVNGNIASGSYPYTWIALNSSTDSYTNLPTAAIAGLPNPELRWEKTYVTNVGLDFGLLKNRLSGTIDVYKKRGRDLLFSFPVNAAYAGTIGNYYLSRNIASLDGKGVDIGLNGIIYEQKNWTVKMGVSFSYNTNNVSESRFDTGSVSSSFKSLTPGGIGNVNGYPTDKLFVFRNAGLDAGGLTRVLRANGDTVAASGTIYFKDLKYAGRTNAPYFGSWNTTVTYKRFSLYALATYQFGNVFLKPTISSYITGQYAINYDVSATIDQRWRKAGDEANTNVPGLSGTNNSLLRYQSSDINVLPGGYVRLREIALSYQLPVNILGKVMKDASFTFAVRNLGLLWRANKEGYDPDFTSYANAYSLPASRSYNVTLNVHF